MTNTDQNNNEKYLKIFVLKEHSETILSDDIIPPAFHSIIFIISGSVDICINNIHKTFLTFDFLLIPNGIRFNILHSEKNPKLFIISFSPGFLPENNISAFNIKFYFLSIQSFMVIPINPEDIPFLKKIFKLIHTAQNTNNHQFQKDLFGVGFNFLKQKHMDSHQVYTGIHSQKQKIIFSFFKSLEQNHKKEHQVKFYADALCITAGYLNKITKELTDKTTKQLIEEAVIIESKTLLHNKVLTISEIAEELHFGSCSSFSSFFKKHTSFSPSDYRFRSPR